MLSHCLFGYSVQRTHSCRQRQQSASGEIRFNDLLLYVSGNKTGPQMAFPHCDVLCKKKLNKTKQKSQDEIKDRGNACKRHQNKMQDETLYGNGSRRSLVSVYVI